MILAVESATPCGSVALVSEGRVLGERMLPRERQVSETFLAAIDRLLGEAGRGQDVVTHVAVSAGPGSFTGLRVGMAAAKGFCFGWGLPIVPVPTLHALASRFPGGDALVCPVLDARKKEVYAGVFRWERGECLRVRPDAAVPPDALPGWFPQGTVFFCGDGAVLHGALFRERMGERALFPPPGEGLPRASSVGLLAERMVRAGEAKEARTVVPAYLRSSEAEVRRGR
ncbi:MAG TPA: tRNA (adenosine(37)-N6)-threonylcarbamoyltransferase complex dimerization subunit type 1 TsaB [Candidatus Deferrimicrobiaceae bacterium]|nr:tRNA (adenosine(37)-N6)-threonylcarbamoyltransferase complex dimerization subunit type 1 TsaB [Candidatus Deferrimicrobiaceae bacterium]